MPVALVPAAVVTVMSTVPANDRAGEVAVIDVAELTVKAVAFVVPNFTAVAPVKLVPVTVTVAPPLPADVWLRPAHRLPWPLAAPGCHLYRRARRGLHDALVAAGVTYDDEVLVPAWHHGSEVEAIARTGATPRFYDLDVDLEPDQTQLEELLNPRVRALHLIHYLGLRRDAARWREWCDGHGLLLIEDAAQAWLAEGHDGPVGRLGDIAIFSLYKTYGLPDGGAAVWNGPSPALRPAGASLGRLGRRHAAWLAARSGLAASALGPWSGQRPYGVDEDFELGLPEPASRATTALLPRVTEPDTAARRRRNYGLLADALPELVPPAFAVVPAGSSPFALPVRVGDKQRFLARLRARGVRAVDLWSVPHPVLDVRRHPDAAERRRSFVALPVHQELTDADVERIVDAVRGRGRAPDRAAGAASATPAGGAFGREEGALVVERTSSLADLEQAWRRLADESRNVFATWEWAANWWRHQSGGQRLLLVTGRVGGEVVAIVPLVTDDHGPLRILRFVGHGATDQLGPICRPEDRSVAATTLRSILAGGGVRWDVLLAERMQGDEGWPELLGSRAVRRAPSPVIRFCGRSWDEYLDDLSRKQRREIRRKERRLLADHLVRIRLADDRDRLGADLDSFFALHQARWRDRSSLARKEQLLRDFAADAFARGWLRLWLMEIDGHLAAARFDLRFQDVYFAYNAGRDPAFARESPGLVLRAHTIRHAIDDGATEYRFLRGGEAYKYRFTDDDPGLDTVVLGRGAAGSALVSMAASVARVAVARRTLQTLGARGSAPDGDSGRGGGI